ncbi:polyphosphate kinase 1 [Fulvivirgaceae bacterium BMA12]|uniref:Polyphosphate kinase n=1 Tax=Agaribacillus aureus TaxID=3051825 RepID=A0ABT8L695_9BACT|nr:polyphosphate kinase 1 [Fulvivirgaceae bacterium BMA12]
MEDSKPFFDRDLSWLIFNYRVLQEAKDPTVPLYERIKFLSIYSSNLDEFFRVRVASWQSLNKLGKKKVKKNLPVNPKAILKDIHEKVNRQLDEFGHIFRNELLTGLRDNKIFVYVEEPIPDAFLAETEHYFRSRVLAYLQPYFLNQKNKQDPFLNNRGIYLALQLQAMDEEAPCFAYVNIPSDHLSRFFKITTASTGHHYVLLDDIVKSNLHLIFPHHKILACHCIKLNKSADLNIEDEYSGDLVEKISGQLDKRNIGPPSRFLYDQEMNDELLQQMVDAFGLSEDELVPGGKYHNLNDFMKLPNPLKPRLEYPKQLPVKKTVLDQGQSIFETISKKDVILHFPYQSYDYVLRFFNEAAIDPEVEEIKVTLYRIAANSLIANALISAVKNGKKVTVFVELKARFDEENNIRWAKKMQKAGINIIYSIPGLKVHAKVALVKRKSKKGLKDYAFFGTGNFNESTASIYADHGLLTCHDEMVSELDQVFNYLQKQKKIKGFDHILVSQFNLQERFLEMIDREIEFARNSEDAQIIIKLNNLEDQVMISKLYEASQAGVDVKLITRGICCLVPNVAGISENIEVYRLVDMYLEHARIFIFRHGGENNMYLSSADWMKRNLYRRIEVGFPIYDPAIRKELMQLINLQLKDNVKARKLDKNHKHLPIKRAPRARKIRAQIQFYNWLKSKQ